MATLIQSKQIQGIVTASVVEGDFVASGAITGSSISASQVLGVKYEDIEGTPNFIAGTGILITQVGNEITITNNSGSSGVTGSAELITSVALLNAYTASTDIRLDGLSSQTGSYLTSLPSGLVSGSDQLTSSYDQRYALSGSVGGGSTDISSLNDYTSSTDSRITNIESFSSSIESRVTTLENQTDNTGSDTQSLSIVGNQLSISDGNTVTIPTGSGGGTSDFTQLTNVPSGLVSSSEQVLGGTGILSGSHTDISSLNNFTSSQESLNNTFATTGSNTFEGRQVFTGSFSVKNYTDTPYTQIRFDQESDISGKLGSSVILDKNNLSITGGDRLLLYTSPNTSSLVWESPEISMRTEDFGSVVHNEIYFDAKHLKIGHRFANEIYIGSGDLYRNSQGGEWENNIYSSVYGQKTQLIKFVSVLSEFTGSVDVSGTFTSSLQEGYLYVGGENDITVAIPTSSLVSGESTDISSLNNFTSSYFTDSQSFDTRITTEKDRVDTILSGASADYDTFKEIVDLINSVDTTNDQAFATFYTASNDKFDSIHSFTQSIESRVSTLEGQTDNTGSDSQTLSIVGDQLTIDGGNTVTIPTGSELPSGVISGSSQITELGFTSESTDISSLNDFTQSYFTDSSSFDTRIDNLISSTVPQGTISGSDQLTGSYDLRYLLSGSDLSVSFNGDREVTNQDLGVSGDNFGTTGSLKDFIEAVFFPNTLPTITYTERDVDVSGSVSGSVAIDVTLTDAENNGPFSFSISGGDSNLFDVVPQNADSSSWDIIISTSSLQVGTYEITGSASDNTNEATILSTTFTVSPINDFGEVYVYTNDRGAGALTPSNYNSVMGGTTVATNGDTPPEFTSFDTGSILDKIGQSLGDSTIDVSAGGNTFTLTRRVLTSGSNLSQVLENAGAFNGDGGVQEQLLVMFASGSDMGGIPTSIAQSFGGSTLGEYVLNVNDAGTFANTISDAQLNSITLDTPHLGFSEWFIIGRTGSNTASSYEIRLTPSSGSAPTS